MSGCSAGALNTDSTPSSGLSPPQQWCLRGPAPGRYTGIAVGPTEQTLAGCELRKLARHKQTRGHSGLLTSPNVTLSVPPRGVPLGGTDEHRGCPQLCPLPRQHVSPVAQSPPGLKGAGLQGCWSGAACLLDGTPAEGLGPPCRHLAASSRQNAASQQPCAGAAASAGVTRRAASPGVSDHSPFI